MSFRLGIVGHEAAKFTERTRQEARNAILEAIDYFEPSVILSGECHLGGVDIWARDIAHDERIIFVGYEPEVLQWDPPGRKGFMARNLEIARNSDLLLCIVVAEYPVGYDGMRFMRVTEEGPVPYCYHCDRPGRAHQRHVKSGGCWTAWAAKNRAWKVIS